MEIEDYNEDEDEDLKQSELPSTPRGGRSDRSRNFSNLEQQDGCLF